MDRTRDDMEEDMELVTCFSEQGDCVIDPVCRLKDILTQALNAYMNELEKHTLHDLLKNHAKLRHILVKPLEDPILPPT